MGSSSSENCREPLEFREDAASRLFSAFNDRYHEMVEKSTRDLPARWGEYVRSLGAQHIRQHEAPKYAFVVCDPVILRAGIISYIGMDEELAMRILALGLP